MPLLLITEPFQFYGEVQLCFVWELSRQNLLKTKKNNSWCIRSLVFCMAIFTLTFQRKTLSLLLCKVYRWCFIFLLVSTVVTKGRKKESDVWATCCTSWCWTNNSICWSKCRRWKPLPSLTVIESFPRIRCYNIICFSSFI